MWLSRADITVQAQEPSEENDDAEAEGSPLEVNPIFKLMCLIFALVLVAIGFVAALKETRTKWSFEEIPMFLPNTSRTLWFSLIFKCAQLFMGIGAILYLIWHFRPYFYQAQGLDNYPTRMLISIFTIFAVLGILCSLTETIVNFIDAIDPLDYRITEIVGCVLLTLFIAAQTVFFFMHNHACLQWKLKKAWLAMCFVLSTNLSLGFFCVSQEMSEIAVENHTIQACNSNMTMKLREKVESAAAEVMLPFLTEFFLMGAVLSGSFLSSAGRSPSQQRDLLPNPRDYGALLRGLADRFRQHPRILIIALMIWGILTPSLSVLMKLFVCENEPWHVASTYILVAFHTIGLVCCIALLLRALRLAGEATVEAKARTVVDRLMLWCGVAAFFVSDLYHFWGALQGDKDLQSAIGTGFVALFNIFQSVLQVYVLECILLERLKPTDFQDGGSRNWGVRLLATLMLINALEWLISAVAFSLFFFSSSSINSTPSLALAVICAPFQVLFRFNSIGCMCEFIQKLCPRGYEPLDQ